MKPFLLILISLLTLTTFGQQASYSGRQLIDSSKVPVSALHKFHQWFPGSTNVKWHTLSNTSVFEVEGKQRYTVDLLLDTKGKVLYLKTKFIGSTDSIFEVPAKVLQRFDSILPKAKDVIWTKGDDETIDDTISSHFHADINGQPDDVPTPDITFDSLGNIYSYEYTLDFPFK
ncbi:MAG TPA: hypothetical protein VN922_06160, partial [Bacteroidia bacterium]|nr:hypothetical protein [Bacteroidia bacterium]